MENKRGYTLIESLLILTIAIFAASLSLSAIENVQQQMIVHQFFASFEKRIAAAQKTAIVNQQQTSFEAINEQTQIFFDVPVYFAHHWNSLQIPSDLVVQRAERIVFAANTGNESSLRAYQFYWPRKNQRITYQFQMGGGRYVKRVE
ncbi:MULTISPECIES: competence type IV pilus minor pilin ComGD [unclassified Enterococcus]|jgi:competence protein ComGD|uniref:competence type IV pilus minor pilin ComGD n=1 Tax=unclassified Enterococcus TaxID=2608891 RepID=UPI003D2AD253